ncbi:MAG: short-chain dehydrogenase [Salinisphaeraceae bacterium]|nr:short-chain dehydrogenase [Salinisphaeraceae bacterium]
MEITRILARDLFAGQTVFITGGGSGINLGIAKNLAALGANVAICGRTQEKLDAAADELRAMGAKVSAVAADVRDIDALKAAMEAARESLGTISVVVAGAAGNFPAAAEKLSSKGFETVVDIDLVGAFNTANAAFDQLRETKGSLIFISAGQAFSPYAWQVHVCAAKAGIDNMMRTLALEWGRFGIRANSIVPGPIKDTEGMKRLAPPGMDDKVAQAVPLKRMGTVDDIGQTACFLASPLASYVSGSLIMVDGGQNLEGSGRWTELMAAGIRDKSDDM